MPDLSQAKPAEAAAGFADIGTAPNTYVVEEGYEVDGDYNFTPEVTNQTRMTFKWAPGITPGVPARQQNVGL